MARRPRADEPGSWHHVINRGIARRPLFERRSDVRFFLARLARQVRLGRIEVHAYCLLTTHFHLLVRSPTGELSEAMRRVQNEYSRHFNRLHRRDGALIRGRFFSKPVRSVEYRSTLVRYIDANPVRAGLVRSSIEFEFSSAKAYATRSGPRWLSREWVEDQACRVAGARRFSPAAYLEAFGVREPRELEEICELIETRTARRAAKDPFDDLVGTAPQQVRAWMRRKALLADGHRLGQPSCGRGTLRAVIDECCVERSDWVVEDGGRLWRGAEIAWFGLLRDLCSCTWDEIADATNGSASRARRLVRLHHKLLAADDAYAVQLAAIGRSAIRRALGEDRRGSAAEGSLGGARGR